MEAKIDNSPLLKQSFTQKVIQVLQDPTLYSMTPNELEQVRMDFFREGLKFHTENNAEFAKAVANLGVDIDNPKLTDLLDLAVSSNEWRGTGQLKYLNELVSKDNLRMYVSSGTTGKEPVTAYRTPLDIYINSLAIIPHFEWGLGHKLNGGAVLLHFAEEMRESSVFVDSVARAYEAGKVQLLYGMEINPDIPEYSPIEGSSDQMRKLTVWERLKPSEHMANFARQKYTTKHIVTGNVGLDRMIQTYDSFSGPLARVKRNKMSDLGYQGSISIGGGPKGQLARPLEVLTEEARKRFFVKNEQGDKVPVPIKNVWGATESITIMSSEPKVDVPSRLIPHPLTITMAVAPQTKKIGNHGSLLVYNPMTVSFFEAFEPGDVVSIVDAPDTYYGKGIIFEGRLQGEGAVRSWGCGEM